MRRCVSLIGLLACASPAAPEPDAPPDSAPVDSVLVDSDPRWRSALYPVDWTPAHTLPDGTFLHDFSYAGYHAGEREPPAALPEPVLTLTAADPTGLSDSTAALQAAIDALSEGGSLLVPAGRYRVDGALTVRRSGVVIAGEGADRTFVHFTLAVGASGQAGLTFRGDEPEIMDERPLTQDGVAREAWLTLADTAGLQVGDRVAVGWVITEAFREAHGMSERWGFAADAWRPFFRRTVLAVEGDRVQLDVPLRYPALLRDGASLRRDDGYLREVGLQDLAISSVVDRAAALSADRHHAVQLVRVEDGWVRRVASYDPVGEGDHLQSGGLYVERSRRVTVSEVELGRPQHRGEGGNGYLFELSRSSEVLVRDSSGREGRHNFIVNWDFNTNGCVFLRTRSEGGRADNGPLTVTGFSELHHALAMANLIDRSEVSDGWQSKNRHGYSSGAGHAGTQNVFWNLSGAGELWSMQAGHGYVIGTAPELTVFTALDTVDLTFGAVGTEPEDLAEGVGLGASLEPASLYEDQLSRRLAR